MISKQKEIFNELADERFEKIIGLDESVNPDNLVYRYKGPNADVKFNELDVLNLLNKIRKGEIKPEDGKNDQIIFKSILG